MYNINFKNLILICFLFAAVSAFAEPIKLTSGPSPLPNGKSFVFEWNGDIWSLSTRCGAGAMSLRQSKLKSKNHITKHH